MHGNLFKPCGRGLHTTATHQHLHTFIDHVGRLASVVPRGDQLLEEVLQQHVALAHQKDAALLLAVADSHADVRDELLELVGMRVQPLLCKRTLQFQEEGSHP